MNRLIYGEDDRLLPWALERTGIPGFRPDARTIGYERDGETVAVVVFDGFSEIDCNMHIASDGTRRWLTRELLTAAFAFPFIQCGLRRVTGLVPARNVAALRFDEHIGFRREGYHARAAKDGDLVSLGMLREWCRFLPQESRA
jgi:RimJ/RimL family protein N-acetyltransferase